MSRIITTEESLLNYAAWYAMRYFPSLRKLHDVLMKKSLDNETLTLSVMSKMREYISEERTVDGLVRMYTEQGKTYLYIKQKLRTKKFGEEIVESILESYRDCFESWETYEQVITRKMYNYLEKHKSKRYITGILVQKYPNFKDHIVSLLHAFSPDESESISRELIKLSKKFNLTDSKERQKVIQKLCLKWFSYDDIRRRINQDDEIYVDR